MSTEKVDTPVFFFRTRRQHIALCHCGIKDIGGGEAEKGLAPLIRMRLREQEYLEAFSQNSSKLSQRQLAGDMRRFAIQVRGNSSKPVILVRWHGGGGRMSSLSDQPVFSVRPLLPEIATTPLWMIHGPADEYTSSDAERALYQLVREPRLPGPIIASTVIRKNPIAR